MRRARRAITDVFSRKSLPPYRPDYSDAALVGNLASGFRQTLFDGAAEVSPLDAAAPAGAVLNYFSNRTSPVIYHAPPVVAVMVETVQATRPDWVSRCLERVFSERHRGLPIYALEGAPLTAPYPWSGIERPPGEDIQYRKRPHRFAFLPKLALASSYSDDVRGWMLEVVRDWMRYAEGSQSDLPFDSNLAVIQRLMAYSWTWLYLLSNSDRDNPGELEKCVLKVMAGDINFLIPRLGTSFANNHLLADRFASWYIAALFPEFDPRPEGKEHYAELWIEELVRQTTPDGWSFEHCSHYHEFACDMAVAYLLLCRANNWPVVVGSEDLIKRMLSVQSDLSGRSGEAIQIGDCTEENFFPLGVHEGHGPGLYREVYRSLFDPALEPVDPQQPAVEVAYWLLGKLREPVAPAPPPSLTMSSHQPGGLVFMRDTSFDFEVLFRTGPARDAPVSLGHVHSDWLSFYVRRGGLPVITDAGTFSYRAQPDRWPEDEPPWRHYLRSPEAHNCVVVSDLDPVGNPPVGDFRNSQSETRVTTRIRARTRRCSWVEASYEGIDAYTGYCRGVLQLAGLYALVVDIHPTGKALAWAGIQFAPGISVTRRAGGLTARLADETTLSIFSCQTDEDLELLRGSLDPLGGWVSPRYGQLEPAWQARLKLSGKPGCSSCLLVDGEAGCAVSSELIEENVLHVKLAFESYCDHIYLRLPDSTGYLETEFFATDADLVWLRLEDESLVDMFAANVSRLNASGLTSAVFDKRESLVELHRSATATQFRAAQGNFANKH